MAIKATEVVKKLEEAGELRKIGTVPPDAPESLVERLAREARESSDKLNQSLKGDVDAAQTE